MNEMTLNFCRTWLIEHLAHCTEGQRDLFRRMYAHKLPEGTPVEKVVYHMHPDKLDWALQQCQNTLDKAAKRSAESET